MLPRECFISAMEIFSPSASGQLAVRDQNIQRYVFIDDMCGSGQQGEDYSRDIVIPLRGLQPNAQVYYYALFGTAGGIDRLRRLNRFNIVHSVVELDDSFRCFSNGSRIYRDASAPLSRDAGMSLAKRFGARLQPLHPTGFKDGQLLLGFAYNTPDNTLPIIWSSGTKDFPWTPVFRRYAKLEYG